MATNITTDEPGVNESLFEGRDRVYAVSGNPFAVIYFLPLIIVSLLILQLSIVFDAPRTMAASLFFAEVVAICAIPAYLLRGRIVFHDEGVEMRFGRNHITCTWDQVTGIDYHPGFGMCLTMKGQHHIKTSHRGMAGLEVSDDQCSIPLRLFGDRRFALIYEVRDHSPHKDWIAALRHKMMPIGAWRPVIVYGLAVGVSVTSIVAMAVATRR